MLLNSLNELDEKGKVGDWCFLNNDNDIFICYPISDEEWAKWYDFPREKAPEINRGDIVHLPIVIGSPTRAQPDWAHMQGHWGWDGNREMPTITPSINVIGRWHGWLRQGKLVTA